MLRLLVTNAYRVALGHRNGAVIFQNPDDCREIGGRAPRLGRPHGTYPELRGRHGPFLPEASTAGIPLVVLPSRMLSG